MLKFKVGDKVKVMSGKDKGREGNIEKIYPEKKTAVLPGINIYKKHVKKQVAADNKGGIYEIPRSIALSKLMVIDPKTKKPTRVGFKVEGGKKLRISKKTGVILDDIGKGGKK
jgi:large subunit ribosomal protein L24